MHLRLCVERAAIPTGDIFCFERLDSTMDQAFHLNAEGAKNYTVVMSREQLRGRGRLGRKWHSAGGSLFTSLILNEFDSNIPYSLIAALGVYRVLRDLQLEVSLKWINDVLCGGSRKIAGVLAEERAECTVIGIGVNVNAELFPPELKDTATSYRCETGKTIDIVQLLCLLLGELLPLIEQAHRGRTPSLMEEWENAAAHRGRSVRLEGEFGSVQGVVAGIERNSGALLLSVDGHIREFYGGSLFFEN
jgi:BirA family biotin operon repressor/biotin-[acetyl-CoA-carboxylase] ligase